MSGGLLNLVEAALLVFSSNRLFFLFLLGVNWGDLRLLDNNGLSLFLLMNYGRGFLLEGGRGIFLEERLVFVLSLNFGLGDLDLLPHLLLNNFFLNSLNSFGLLI